MSLLQAFQRPSHVDADAVRTAYRTVLGREPDATGSRLPTERSVWEHLLRSDEFQARPQADREVALSSYLERYGDTSGIEERINWFHSIDLGEGHITNGQRDHGTLKAEAEIMFRHPPAGKTVLDIGAWDGFFSFEAERRGAKAVLATDHFCWSGPGWGTKAGFDYAHRRLGSRVDSLDIDLPDLTPDAVGTFDIVIFSGVLYHLKDPYAGLEQAARLATDCLIVETQTALNFSRQPVMRFYKRHELNNDPSNFWAPNVVGLRAMLQDLDFCRVEITPHPTNRPWRSSGRHTAHAFR